MGYIMSAVIGLALGLGLSVIGIIPLVNLCACFISPLLIVGAGYAVGMTAGLGRSDWVGLAINNAVFAFAGAVMLATVQFVSGMLGLGLTAMQGADMTTLGLTGVTGIVGILLQFGFGFVYYAVLGIIGGAIYLLTGAKK